MTCASPSARRALNLVGVSYGTRVALEYLRRHPAATRSVVLDGVVPPELALGSEHARNLEAARERAVSSGAPPTPLAPRVTVRRARRWIDCVHAWSASRGQ